jgi:hypothetical protein
VIIGKIQKIMQELHTPIPLNPLHHFILIAEISSKYWEKCNKNNFSDIYLGEKYLTRLPKKSYKTSLPKYLDKTIYPDVETAGIAGLYNELKEKTNYNVIFSNELAHEIHGIDALAYSEEENLYLICEAKRSTIQKRSPSYYLKNTKKRGRQLSWQWCWNCIVDFAEFPATANVFLELYKQIILNRNVKRLLSVSFCQNINKGYIIQNTKIWDESALNCYEWFNQKKDFSKQKKWLQQIERYNDYQKTSK